MKASNHFTIRMIRQISPAPAAEFVTFHDALPAVRWIEPEDIVAEYIMRPGSKMAATPERIRHEVGILAREFFEGWEEIGTSDLSAATRSACRDWGIDPTEAPADVLGAMRTLVAAGIRSE